MIRCEGESTPYLSDRGCQHAVLYIYFFIYEHRYTQQQAVEGRTERLK